MKTFRFGRTEVAWSATFEDGQAAWRCITSTSTAPITILVSGVGSGTTHRGS